MAITPNHNITTSTGIPKIVYLICPGIHGIDLTNEFLESFVKQPINSNNLLVFPTHQYPAYSGFHILQFLEQKCEKISSQELIIISFSAGVVGAIGAAWGWQLKGGKIKAFIAFDGWGVPLVGNFPIYRVSHDYFTHWSSALLGNGKESFYADPAIEHLALWRSPQNVTGWRVQTTVEGKEFYSSISLTDFLTLILTIHT